MAELFDPQLVRTLHKDKQALEQSELPIVTVSASFREDVKGQFGFPEDETIPDVVFSRAHYSMAVGIATQSWKSRINPKKAWVVDPTNYVSHDDWKTITFTEIVGKTIARHPALKTLKDFIDTFGRKKLPILESITQPLLYLTQDIHHPILSLHIAAGNILAGQGKTVVQVITDPHVRHDYLEFAEKPNMHYCVFDERTKQDLLEKAALLELAVDPDRIVVTGPPVDPRITAAATRKQPWRSGPLKLCLTTGGLGTNKGELRTLLQQLLPELRRRTPAYQLIVYCSTHKDIFEMVTQLAREERVAVAEQADQSAKLRVLYHPQIVDANELLIRFAFPWADGFLTKPSGDMAYDAAASGSFLLTLQEWGEWEEVIRETFVQRDIARKAITQHIVAQLESLTATHGTSQSWVERAQLAAHALPTEYKHGAKNITAAYHTVRSRAQ